MINYIFLFYLLDYDRCSIDDNIPIEINFDSKVIPLKW